MNAARRAAPELGSYEAPIQATAVGLCGSGLHEFPEAGTMTPARSSRSY